MSGGRVLVYARTRPLSERERGDLKCVEMLPETGEVIVRSDGDAVERVLKGDGVASSKGVARTFELDECFPDTCSQKEVFQSVGLPVLADSMNGFNGCIFAYGQTGTGKTFSLLNTDGVDTEKTGLLPRLVATLFVRATMDKTHVYKVEAGSFQVYNEQVDDLLHPRHKEGAGQNLSVSKGKVNGLTWVTCTSPSEMLGVFQKARSGIHYAETKMNKTSSRSHAVFQIRIIRRPRSTKIESGNHKVKITCGQLTVVDLAGSERVKKSGVTGEEFKQATNINASLLALGNVIQALANKSKHVPFRDSKLTRILEGSVGGNCKTSLLVCISPANENCNETISTLEFASRAMRIEVKATVNEEEVEIDAEKLAAELQEEIPTVDEEMIRQFKEGEAALENQVRAKTEELNALRLNMEQRTTELERARRDIESKDREMEKSVELYSELQRSHQQEIERTEKVKKSFQQRIDQVERQLRETSRELETTKAQFLAERERLRAASSRLKHLEEEMIGKDKRASLMLHDASEKHIKTMQESQAKIDMIEQEKRELQDQLAQVRSTLAEFERRNQELMDAMENEENAKTALRDKLEAAQTLVKELDEVAKQVPLLRGDLQTVSHQLADEKSSNLRLTTQLSEMHVLHRAKEESMRALDLRITTLQTNLKSMEDENARVNTQVIELEADLIASKEREQLMENDLKSMKIRHSQEVKELEARQAKMVLEQTAKHQQEMERKKRRAAMALRAVEERAEQDLERMHMRLKRAEEIHVEHQKLHGTQVETMSLQLEEQKRAGEKALENFAKDQELRRVRLSCGYHAAAKAVESELKAKDEKYQALVERFLARESRKEDLDRIARCEQRLRQQEQTIADLKAQIRFKDLELDNIKLTDRVFGNRSDAKKKRRNQKPNNRVAPMQDEILPQTNSRPSSSLTDERPETPGEGLKKRPLPVIPHY